MATAQQWESIAPYFMPDEFADGVSPLIAMGMRWELLDRLYQFRKYINRPIHIHSGYAKDGHTERSEHYSGWAADIHIAGVLSIGELFAMWVEIERWGFVNIGVYPYWLSPGFHLGMRPPDGEGHPAGARWGCGPEPGDYRALTLRFWAEALDNV